MGDRTCANCDGSLEAEHARKYCSRECFHEGHSFVGENNPNYRGGKEVTECEICGSVFEYYPTEKEGLYCADCVKNEEWRTPLDISGSNNPRWKGGKEERNCGVCGDTVKRHPSGFTGRVTVCSETCRQTWLSDSFTGAGHPNWKGGGDEAYGAGWNGVRRRALERDDHTCVICGKSRGDIGRNPDVHHIVPVRTFVEAEGAEKRDAHVLRNVVSLCLACHRRADFGRPTKIVLKRLVGRSE